jgi:hypothetical protein
MARPYGLTQSQGNASIEFYGYTTSLSAVPKNTYYLTVNFPLLKQQLMVHDSLIYVK